MQTFQTFQTESASLTGFFEVWPTLAKFPGQLWPKMLTALSVGLKDWIVVVLLVLKYIVLFL